jgi:uncharacterized protein
VSSSSSSSSLFGVWERSGADTISKNLYSLMICVWTAFGIGLSAVGSYLSLDMKLSWPLVIMVLIVSFAGIFVAESSENPLISLIGYSMVAIPFGFMLGPVVAHYTTVSVMKVFVITSAVVTVLGLIGAFIPDSLDSWGGPLMALLLCSIVGYLIVPFSGFFGIPIETGLNILDWGTLLVFGGVILYDLNRAMRIPYTHDNAIDVALGVYLDWVNFFIRLLRLFGILKSND